MGKSECARVLSSRGLPVCDTDDLARSLVERGQPALEQVKATFGDGVLRSDGTLDRGHLARIVFADSAARQKLEAILHPRIRALWRARAEGWKGQGIALGVVVIPLLFETGAGEEFDATVCVACSATSQRERLLARGWPERQLHQRVAAQWPIEEKMRLAHYAIWSEGGLRLLPPQLERVLSAVTGSI